MSNDEIKVPKILICILTTYERSGWPHPDLLDFVYSLRFNFSYATAFVKAHNFIPAAGARNFFCRNMKDTDADWLLMIDNDMSPAANLLDTIKDAPADPAKNAGYGKLYVQEIDSDGEVMRDFKDGIGPDGFYQRKWIAGGPVKPEP